jgi:hypothetical protein
MNIDEDSDSNRFQSLLSWIPLTDARVKGSVGHGKTVAHKKATVQNNGLPAKSAEAGSKR